MFLFVGRGDTREVAATPEGDPSLYHRQVQRGEVVPARGCMSPRTQTSPSDKWTILTPRSPLEAVVAMADTDAGNQQVH